MTEQADDRRGDTVTFEGTVAEVVAQPTGFLLEDVSTYRRGRDDPEHSAEKFVSFDGIQEIDVQEDASHAK